MELHLGIIRENITTQGLNVNSLEMGLRIGTVLLQVSAVCTPCDQPRKGASRFAPRDVWQTRHAVPRSGKWNDSRRQRNFSAWP